MARAARLAAGFPAEPNPARGLRGGAWVRRERGGRGGGGGGSAARRDRGV